MFKFFKNLFFPSKDQSRPVNKTTHYERDVQMTKEEPKKICGHCDCEDE